MESVDLKKTDRGNGGGDLVVITGAAGNLGTALTPLLKQAGYRVRLVDIKRLPAQPGVEVMVADLRQPQAAAWVLNGATWLVHGAAWHGIHLNDHQPEDFWELNVDATFHLYQAAILTGLAGVVFSSTMGVYGLSGKARQGRATRVHEGLPLLADDVYGLSKVIGEELAATLARQGKMRTVALRYGMFVPEPFERYGVRLLYGGVDARDVATAVLAALGALKTGSIQFDAMNIESALPFTDGDAETLVSNPMSAVSRHWPEAPALVSELHADLWGPIERWFDISRAKDVLGWTPKYNFDQFIDEVRAKLRGSQPGNRSVPQPKGPASSRRD
jgi:nucleoside-diphosphate-sugar epimerase